MMDTIFGRLYFLFVCVVIVCISLEKVKQKYWGEKNKLDQPPMGS